MKTASLILMFCLLSGCSLLPWRDKHPADSRETTVSVELSMYPFTQEYIPPIDAFLKLLNTCSDDVKTNRMSTLVYGDYDTVMFCIEAAIKQVRQRHGPAVFVLKVIPGADRTVNGYK